MKGSLSDADSPIPRAPKQDGRIVLPSELLSSKYRPYKGKDRVQGTVIEYVCLDPRNADPAKEVGNVDAWGRHDAKGQGCQPFFLSRTGRPQLTDQFTSKVDT